MSERPRDRAEMLLEAGVALSSELSLPSVLQRLVELAVAITDARYGALGVLGPGGTIHDFVTIGVTEAERRAIGDLPHGRGILGALIHDARPLRLRSIADDPRSVGFPPNHPPMKSFLGAPVMARGKVYGNLYLTEKRGADEFSAEDQEALTILATQAGVAIENAYLYDELRQAQQELRRLAVLEDRERIARELHDGVIQSLFAVGMGLQGAAGLAGDPTLSARLEGAVEELDRVVRDLRNYIFGLRPGILADRQLDQALRELAEGFGQRSGVITVVHVDPAVAAMLSARATEIVQIAREALSNVGRHAQATTCRLSLSRDDGRAELVIDDDGRGFDPASPRAGGQGLSNLAARAASLGGQLDISSDAGEGTTVRVTIPL